MDYQTAQEIAAILYLHRVRNIIICPGSRSAPLTISFARHAGFKKYVIPDERSAGFIGLGMAQITRSPVVIICTSGTSVYNLAPAVSEAYYRKVPLIILTADRPPEWVDQGDGQSIHQNEVYGKNCKWQAVLPTDVGHPDSRWHALRLVSEAALEAINDPAGPVHLNIPIREPLYPQSTEIYQTEALVKNIQYATPSTDLRTQDWEELGEIWKKSKNILILPGQSYRNDLLQSHLKTLSENFNIPVICDALANFNGEENFIYKHELFLSDRDNEAFHAMQPDLVISFGNSILSKKIKLLLRKYRPAHHWHIQKATRAPDTFQSLTRILPVDETGFFERVNSSFPQDTVRTKFYRSWHDKEILARKIFCDFFPCSDFGELEAVNTILQNLSGDFHLHLANSMPVRLANFSGIRGRRIEVYSNRGTNGIDGCMSTAAGSALASESRHLLITGDMSFFYDRNALWHNYSLVNLKIVVLNNHGGGIFKMLEGTSRLPELEEYFETNQRLTAENTARDFNFQYHRVSDKKSLDAVFPEFINSTNRPAILEIESKSEVNKRIFTELMHEMENIWT